MTAVTPDPGAGAARGFRIRALGEIALRCADLAAMTAFYRDVIGLEILADRGGPEAGAIRFFRIAEGHAGHAAVLALFESRESPATGARSSLHHIALSLGHAEQDAAIAWFERIGQPCRIEHFDWIGWRGVFVQDPEGNTVELVAATGDAQREATA